MMNAAVSSLRADRKNQPTRKPYLETGLCCHLRNIGRPCTSVLPHLHRGKQDRTSLQCEIDIRTRLRHTPSVAHHPKPSAKNATGEYAVFEGALKKILSVSHSEIKSKITAEKRKKVKNSSASRVSDA